jgi:hypothetical protein
MVIENKETGTSLLSMIGVLLENPEHGYSLMKSITQLILSGQINPQDVNRLLAEKLTQPQIKKLNEHIAKMKAADEANKKHIVHFTNAQEANNSNSPDKTTGTPSPDGP